MVNASVDERNHPMIVGALKFERFDAKEFGDQVYSRMLKFKRNRSRLIKYIGTWWFKELPAEEIVRDKIMKVQSGIHTEKQLADFMCKQQSVLDECEFVQWRVWLIEDYSKTESIFVYKFHHSVTDGIGSVL